MKFIRYWVPFWLIALSIFCLSSLPGNQLPNVSWLFRCFPPCIAENFDKIIHAGIYAVLSAALLRALMFGNGLRLPLACAVALLVCAAYGAGDEWHQRFVPGRSCDVFDWVADVIGSLAALVVLYVPFLRRYAAKSRSGAQAPSPVA